MGDRPWITRVAVLGAGLAVLCAAAAALSGPGYRLGWWGLGPGFTLLRFSAYGLLAAAGLSVVFGGVALFARSGRAGLWAAIGIVVGIGTFLVPWSQLRTARSVPPIHDITTDTQDPPPFVAILPLRAEAPNPAEYGGSEIAQQQRSAYPDIVSASFDLPAERVFSSALTAAESLGWEIVAADAEAGRIEATDTTFWFGFKDDVVIRVRASDGGGQVDVRSVSRVGRSDVGKNAARIRSYLQRLEEMARSG